MISSLLAKVGAAILAPLVFLTTVFAPTPAPEPVGVALPSATAVFETSLAAPITAAATSMTLSSNSVRGGGTLSGYQCFTIDEGSAQAEYVCGTVSGTTVSSLERGLSPANGTTTDSDVAFSHRRGASVKITDFPVLQRIILQNSGLGTYTSTLSYESAVSIATSSYQIPHAAWVQQAIVNQAVTASTTQTITGAKTFATGTVMSGTLSVSGTSSLATTSLAAGSVTATPTNGTDIANKTYVDGVAVAGASNADETTKGIVEEATAAETIAYTAAGGTGASLYVAPDKLDDFVAASFPVTYATSSNNTYVGQSVSMDANDVLIVWAYSNDNDSSTCNSTAWNMNLVKRSSNASATTTVQTVGDASGVSGSCSLATAFTHVATTTETMVVGISLNGTTGTGDVFTNTLLTQLIRM